jgi:hypothetical protein
VPQAHPGFEVADGELDPGVAAVILVQPHRSAGPVGDNGVVAPVGKQLGLGADRAGAAHDQPVALVAGLGHLRQATVGVDDVGPGGLVDRLDRLSDRLGLADRDGVVELVAAPARSPRSISASAVCSMPSRSASVAGSSPALATAWVSSKQMSSRSRVWVGMSHRESDLLI